MANYMKNVTFATFILALMLISTPALAETILQTKYIVNFDNGNITPSNVKLQNFPNSFYSKVYYEGKTVKFVKMNDSDPNIPFLEPPPFSKVMGIKIGNESIITYNMHTTLNATFVKSSSFWGTYAGMFVIYLVSNNKEILKTNYIIRLGYADMYHSKTEIWNTYELLYKNKMNKEVNYVFFNNKKETNWGKILSYPLSFNFNLTVRIHIKLLKINNITYIGFGSDLIREFQLYNQTHVLKYNNETTHENMIYYGDLNDINATFNPKDFSIIITPFIVGAFFTNKNEIKYNSIAEISDIQAYQEKIVQEKTKNTPIREHKYELYLYLAGGLALISVIVATYEYAVYRKYREVGK